MQSIPKSPVTPAEILVLQAIHGADAILSVEFLGDDEGRTVHNEWERLSQQYDSAPSRAAGTLDEVPTIMSRLFPGAIRKLPMTLEEAGLSHMVISQPATAEAAGLDFSPATEVQHEGAE